MSWCQRYDINSKTTITESAPAAYAHDDCRVEPNRRSRRADRDPELPIKPSSGAPTQRSFSSLTARACCPVPERLPMKVHQPRGVPCALLDQRSAGVLVQHRSQHLERSVPSRAYFAGFHLLTGIIVPSGVFTSEPVHVMTSPLNEIFCVRTLPLKRGEAARSTFHMSTISASLTVYVP